MAPAGAELAIGFLADAVNGDMTFKRALAKRVMAYFLLIGIGVHVAVVGLMLLWPDFVISQYKQGAAEVAARLHWLSSKDERETLELSPENALSMALRAWVPPNPSTFPAGAIDVDGRVFTSLRKAAEALEDDSLLRIGPGVYREAMVIRPDRVRVVGQGHAVLESATAEGKAAIVVKGNDVLISGIACRGISVKDRNGACVRLEGRNLELDGVYFRDSESGLLTGSNPGLVRIRGSRLELLGRAGSAHAIYTGGGRLVIEDTLILSSKEEGHEVKSRSNETTIRRSIIASLNGTDSRLIDVPHGGVLNIEQSVLAQGPSSANIDAIGFGLEGELHHNHQVLVRKSMILLERTSGNRLFHAPHGLVSPVFSDNIIIAAEPPAVAGMNIFYTDRAEAGIGNYPSLPGVPLAE